MVDKVGSHLSNKSEQISLNEFVEKKDSKQSKPDCEICIGQISGDCPGACPEIPSPSQKDACPKCKGTGKVSGQECPDCKGRGRLRSVAKL